MKQILLIAVLTLMFTLFAEFNFSNKIIISNTNIEPVFAYPIDLDGDEDFDVITISGGDNIVGWFENLDGLGNFGQQQIISDAYNIPASVAAADFDGDTDLDIVVAFYLSDMIIWFRHIDGTDDFEVGQIIASDRDGAFGISVGDLDNDNDMDILSASWEDDTLCWYENTDGLGNFTLAQIIDDNAAKACRIIPADLDLDGDLDAVAATNFTEDKIYWFENSDGLGNFVQSQIITTNVQNVLSIWSSDLDNDGDLDILSSSSNDNKAAWYENVNGNFGTQQIISSNSDDAFHISTADLDNDNDDDVLVSCGIANRIEVFENLGSAEFGSVQYISTTASFVHSVLSADFDGDDDLDLVSAFWGSDEVVWFRNEQETSTGDELHNSISPIQDLNNYPNPFNPNTEIRFQISDSSEIGSVEIEIYNLKGQKIKTIPINSSTHHPINSVIWNGSNQSNNPVSSGIYYYKLNIPTSPVKKMILIR